MIVGNCIPNFNDIVQRVAEISFSYDFTILWARDPQKLSVYGIQLNIFTNKFKMSELVDEYSLKTVINFFGLTKLFRSSNCSVAP